MTEIHGKRLLPTTIDQIAHDDPSRVWAAVQVADAEKFEDIPISVFANAINRCAHWITDTIGRPPAGEKPVVAYIGASDLRYYVYFLAIVKSGYVPLFTSHLNSKAANISLFEATKCSTLLYGFDDIDQVAIDTEAVKSYKVPSSEETWDATPVGAFPFTRSFEDAYHDPLLILHTSGSSGLPKPITYIHGSFATTDTRQDLSTYDGQESEPQFRRRAKRALIGFPPFHAAGFLTGLQDSVFWGCVIVFPAASKPLDVQAVITAIDHADIKGAAVLPHVIEGIARSPEALERLHKLQYIVWVGGPISQTAGDLISARTTLMNAYASTELGASNTIVKKDSSLWSYYFFYPKVNGFDFRQVPGQPDLYELFVVKDPSLNQHVFRVFPDLAEWPMKDLFSKHPTLEHHYRLEGRSDDLIVFHNGNKLNPRGIEQAIKSAPGVKEVLMFGSKRTRPGVLIEPEDDDFVREKGEAGFIDGIFPAVEESNSKAQQHGQVLRELLLVTKPDKPLPRTGKRTVQRGAALKLYESEIEELYRALPDSLRTVKDFRIGAERAS